LFYKKSIDYTFLINWTLAFDAFSKFFTVITIV